MNKLSNLPYVGCNDYPPSDYRRIEYIFSKWRELAKKYGYEEYLTPVLERAEIYEAKSGEDIKKELYILTDGKGRRLALRPEMTPSVTRLVTKLYASSPKPLRYFSIANFFRGERPQKGRDREFWQLNIDIFGSESIYADLEILMSAIDLMRSFNAPQSSYILKINHRKLIDYFLSDILKIVDSETKTQVVRKLDKYKKLTHKEFIESLHNIGLNSEQIVQILEWMQSDFYNIANSFSQVTENQGFKDILFLLNKLAQLGYSDHVKYASDLIRGFDYYDGVVFEVFDLNPNLTRSLFGGGRYNGLAEIFGSDRIPAVGYAPGSPISIFLDNWNLWPDFDAQKVNYFLPILSENLVVPVLNLASNLRQTGKIVETSIDIISLSKALSYANTRKFKYVIIYGEDEYNKSQYLIKDMHTGEQVSYSI
jgi:histidyl-tRNA synthetase